MTYEQLIHNKIVRAQNYGQVIERDRINPMLFEFQKDLVVWAIGKGRAALFCDTGLGKTFMQLEWARIASELSGGRALILVPLAVAHQTVKEAAKLGIKATYCKNQSEADKAEGVIVVNYDRLEDMDTSKFSAVVLDESSILKAFSGKTKQMLCSLFSKTPWRLACTATPAPNDHMELGNHSQFLGWLDSSDMLARWFINDTMEAGAYRLKKHAEIDFWEWVCSWAACVTLPSDLGYSDEGYALPGLTIEEIICDSNHTPDDALFHFGAPSATNLHKVQRASLTDRVAASAALVASEPNEPWVIWCNTNDESKALAEAIPGSIEVVGSQSVAVKEDLLGKFSDGDVRVLITKASIAGHGMNWQHCARTQFVGLSYSYEQQYQAMRRFYRFGQTREVKAWIITAEAEAGVLKSVKEKQAEHERMKEQMKIATQANTLRNVGSQEYRGLTIHQEESTDQWRVMLSDCVVGMKSLPENSIGLSVFSPPFSNLYIYSDDPADMGNTDDDRHFFEQFDYAIEELHRIMKPGRIVCVHCKDLPMYKGRDGAMGLRDFPGEIVRRFEGKGFVYHSRVTIWKDPVIEMQRTKNHGLLYKELCKDSAGSRQGMADYMVMFRKWDGEFTDPVTRGAERFVGHDYIGEDPPTANEKIAGYERYLSISVWQKYASPVWFDIRQTNVLNYRAGTSSKDEKHICPLQLDVIERCVELWSNPGDTVFSPFTGIGSEGYVAVKMGRKFIGTELKESYFNQAVRNLREAESIGVGQVGLFDEVCA